MRPALFVLVGVFIVVILAIFVFVSEREPVFDVKSEMKISEVMAGSSLEFRIIIINPDNVKLNVTLLHELVIGNTLLGQKRVVIAVAKTQDFLQSFPIQSALKSGNYVIRTTAYFDGSRAESEINISVLSAGIKETVVGEKQALEEVGVIIPEESAEESVKPESRPKTPLFPLQASDKNMTGVVLVNAETKEECAKSPDVRSRDFCYAQFAYTIPEVCELIESSDLNEWCGMIRELKVPI